MPSFKERVLAAGFFPQELPPPFTTIPFASFAEANTSYIPDLSKKYLTKLVRHHLAQVGRNRRILSIPNPINQLRLVETLSQNFSSVFRHTGSSNISASRPWFDQNAVRAISPRSDFQTMPKLRAKARATARYILSTDISRFYPSIYTHSVPWAFHTKSVSKQDRSSALFGNLLDQVLRESQDGQTIGIPIGPDTSLVIAEAILASVDSHFRARFPDIGAFRWYDDYEVSGKTKGDCELALVSLEGLLADFELDVNVAKTGIIELPLSIEEAWVDELREADLRGPAKQQFKSINSFFSRAFDHAVNHKKKSVLRYAVKKVHGANIHQENWTHVQRLMAQAAIHEPEVLPHVLAVVNFYQSQGLGLDQSLLSNLLCEIIDTYAKRLLGSEVAWAIWGFIQFNLQIPERCVESAIAIPDDVVWLLLLDSASKGLVANRTSLDALRKMVVADSFKGEHWLFCYEAVKKGWITPPAPQLTAFKNDVHVSALLAADVYFYKEGNEHLMPSTRTAKHFYGTPKWLWYKMPDEIDPLDTVEDGVQ